MRAVLVIGLVATLSGCTTMGKPNASFSEPYPDNYRQLVVDGIRQNYFDPYSVRDAEIAVPRQGPSWDIGGKDGWVVCVRANAKNRLGGYVGKSDSAFMIVGGKVVSYLDGPAPYYCGDVTYSPFPEAVGLT